MRGGFIASFGRAPKAGQLERAVAAFRWHRGPAREQAAGRLHLVALEDDAGGPSVETSGAGIRLVHGEASRPLPDLLRDGRRFAVLESSDAGLAAARDPLGLAPLFYRPLGEAIWMSSELGPLAALGTVRPDLGALAAQAALVPDDAHTGFAGIFRVLPGFRIDIQIDLAFETRRYWQVAKLFSSYRGDRAAAEAELEARFVAAVDRTLAPDTAILLSGGIDSTAVTAAASHLGRHFKLVHVSFPQFADAAEEDHARRISTALGRPLEVVLGETEPWRAEEDLHTSVVPYLTPPALAAEAALGRLAGVARVALDGNDGDGVLGYAGREWGELMHRHDFRRLSELAHAYGRRRVLRSVADDLVPPAMRLRSLRRRPELKQTYVQSTECYFDASLHSRMEAIDYERWKSPLHAWRDRQLRQVLPVSTIRNEEHELRGARFGIDMRHPFADRDLVEFLISLPVGIKSDPGRSKELLRSALARHAPDAVLERGDKPEYRAVLATRVDPTSCLEWIRASGVELPLVRYERLYRDAELSSVPTGLLMFLARAHVFAAMNS